MMTSKSHGEGASSWRLARSLTASMLFLFCFFTAGRSLGQPADQLPRMAKDQMRQQGQRYASAAHKLFTQGRFAAAASAFARAYAVDPQTLSLVKLAQSCRKAELEREALGLYQRLLADPAMDVQRGQLDEELKTLGALLEDTEAEVSDVLRSHSESGRQAFQRGQYEEAIKEYALGYAIRALPRLLFNIAQAHRRAGQPLEAYLFYTRFLAEEQTGPLRKEALGYLKELRAAAFPTPVYKRAWFWGMLAGAATLLVVGTAGLAVGLSPKDRATDLGTHVQTFALSY